MKVFRTNESRSFGHEIGVCREIDFEYPNNSEMVLTGGVIDLSKLNAAQDVNILLVDWKTPLPPGQPTVRINTQQRQQLDSAVQMIAVLLNMLGGAVHVSPSDMAQVLDKTFHHTSHGDGLILRLEDK